MQSRRNDSARFSPSARLRNHNRVEVGQNSYAVSQRGAMDYSPQVQHGGLSPHNRIEGSRSVYTNKEGRSGSTERKDHRWHFSGSRAENMSSGSSPYLHEHKRHHFDEGVVRRNYEYVEDINYDHVKSDRLKQVYEYDNHAETARIGKEKDHIENRIDGNEIMGQKSNPMDNEMTRGSYWVPPYFIPASSYGETGERITLPLRCMDINQFEHFKHRYQEPIPSDRRPMMELYKEGVKPILHTRDVSYGRVPVSHPNDFGSTSQFENFVVTSSGNSRSEFQCSYREGVSLPPNEQQSSNMTLTESIDYNIYGQRLVSDARDLEADKKIIKSYGQGSYGLTGAEHDDYLYPKSLTIPGDDYGYPHNDIQRLMTLRYQPDYEHTRMDNEQRVLPRTSIIHPVMDKVNHKEDSCGSMRKSFALDHPSIQMQADTGNFNTSRTSYSSKCNREFLASGYSRFEFGRREPRDDEASHLGIRQDNSIPYIGSDNGFGRDSGPKFHEERLQDHPMFINDSERQRHIGKRLGLRMKERPFIYEPSDNILKRKYLLEDDMNMHDPRTIMYNKWNVPKEFEDQYDSGEDWIEEETVGLHDHRGDFASKDLFSSQDFLAHARMSSVRHNKLNVKYVKGHSKSDSLSWYNSNQIDRSGVHRHHSMWKRNDHYNENARANDDGPPKDWVDVTESEPAEDSEEFKQLVNEAFLMYSKKLNLNSAVRKRYKEQGKAGSLFCIVCGQSSSKEFMNTQRLVRHAFMSHKVGLRARHLGLHKAICVLMGWNTFVPCDTITWVSDDLPDAEALAQKEDLILWPPVLIIRNISMSNDNPEQQKVIPTEGVETFVRGKGFIGGKIKVCLGKPADQSVILVKFLGTFTGLGNAEKLHKYFVENKRGREEFEQKTSSSSSSSWEAGTDGEKLEELLLYGYMGIAEDLDLLDFNTKNWIAVKSKREIQDLANDPVKADDR